MLINFCELHVPSDLQPLSVPLNSLSFFSDLQKNRITTLLRSFLRFMYMLGLRNQYRFWGEMYFLRFDRIYTS